jgi:hypothetical protein
MNGIVAFYGFVEDPLLHHPCIVKADAVHWRQEILQKGEKKSLKMSKEKSAKLPA